MTRHLVHGIDIQLILVVHGNVGEDGGTCTLMELVLLIQILTASVIIVEVLTKFPGQNSLLKLLKPIPKHLK